MLFEFNCHLHTEESILAVVLARRRHEQRERTHHQLLSQYKCKGTGLRKRNMCL